MKVGAMDCPRPFKFMGVDTGGPKTILIYKVWSHGWLQNLVNSQGLEPWMAPKPYTLIEFGNMDGPNNL